jgi:tetratricopeptide (TPR) repeat protein
MQDPSILTSRFLLLEAKAFLVNGLAEDAQADLDLLRELPNWETEVEEGDLLATELGVLKALGQPADALKLLESRLIPLDETDPPYPPSVAALHLLRADLLLACLRNNEAVEVLFDLIQDSDPRLKPSIARSLLSAAGQQALDSGQWKKLPEVLSKVEGNTSWPGFVHAAFEAGRAEDAAALLIAGVQSSASILRALWPSFIESIDQPEFLQLVSKTILEATAEQPAPIRRDWLAIRAMTLETSGRQDEAIDLIRGQLWNDSDMRMRVAGLLAARGDIAGASSIFAELEATQPGFYLERWGSMLADAGMTREALVIWSRIPQVENRAGEGYLRWAQLLKSKGFLKEAAEACRLGVQESPQPAGFAQELLDVSISMTDVEGALSAYQILRGQSQKIGGLWSPERLIDQLKRTQQMDVFCDKLTEVLNATGTLTASWRDFAVEMQTELSLQLGHGSRLEAWLATPPEAVTAYWENNPQRRANHLLGIAMDLVQQGESSLASSFFSELDFAYLAARPNALEAAARSSGIVGDSTRAFELWNQLIQAPQSSADQKVKASLAIARLFLDLYQPGKALDALSKVPSSLRVPTYHADVTFLRALAYTQLHEKSKALPLLQEVVAKEGVRSSEGQFWLAEWSLWQRDWEEAKRLYQEVLDSDPGQMLANEALWRLRYLSELEEVQLPAFSLAAFFEAGGEWQEAEKNYRNLAAALGASGLTDWIYFRIGKILLSSGKRQEALDQWRVVKERTQNSTLTDLMDYELAGLPPSEGGRSYQDIVLEMPNTLLGDLAREKIQSQPTPTPAPESQIILP